MVKEGRGGGEWGGLRLRQTDPLQYRVGQQGAAPSRGIGVRNTLFALYKAEFTKS